MEILPGRPSPLGATPEESVIVVWSPAAKRFPGLAAVVNPVVHELALDVVWRR